MAAKKKPKQRSTGGKKTEPRPGDEALADNEQGAMEPTGGAEPAPSESASEGRTERPGPPVAGIGASAGGLDAFKKFFTAAPADGGVAYVLIPHLDPKHESLMVELLARFTRMPVAEAEDGDVVEANRVYVIPPNNYMTIADGILRLSGPVARRGPQTSIDLFLRSLADDKQDKAICIILSGTGAHGALGLKAVKAAGGLTMVQAPGTAEYPGMPQNAIATGLVDFILPVEQMPETLLRYIQHYDANGGRAQLDTAEGLSDELSQVLALLRVRTKLDFRHYRKRMLTRRIERRMSLSHFSRLPDYLAYLRQHPDELQQLARDLLITVTSFFRDLEAWQTLDSEVIGPLVRVKEPDEPLRIWSAGCATGEEAYSLGILVLEHLAAAQKNCPVQIFATDVDDTALDVARQAVYPDTISADVSPERLTRFFTRLNDSAYQVSKQLRETVIFAHQNLISDAPFSRLDLIVCRNLLIYLEADVQRKVISLLHFALNNSASLFLGPSETIGRQTDLFAPLSKKWRIYRRIGPPRPERVEFPIAAADPLAPVHRATRPAQPRPVNFSELLQGLLVEKFAPASVLVNRQYEILCYSGPVDRYLGVSPGLPTQDLLEMAREGLRTKLRSAIHKAVREGTPVAVGDVQLKRDDHYYLVNVEISPLEDPRNADGLVLITFSDSDTKAPPRQRPAEAANDESVVRQLENELKATKEDLQTTIEELESSNEELKASNEEIMSMNEELQSANEELETSKEELQSLNEELGTVNNQLQDKVGDLETANNDLANFLDCTDIATVFLDSRFCIRRFTPAATRLFSLIPSDVGRSIGDIVKRFVDDDLLADATQFQHDLQPREKEVRLDDGGWCLRRIVPYRTLDNRIDGVVFTFADITERKQTGDAVVRRLAAIVESSADAICSQDLDGTIRTWNAGAERLYGYSAHETIGQSIRVIIPGDRLEEWTQAMSRLAQGERVEELETERVRKGGQRFPVVVRYSPLRDNRGSITGVSATARDISERKRAEEALYASDERMRAILDTAADAIVTIDRRGIVQSVNGAAERMFGYAPAEMVGQNVKLLMPPPYRDEHDAYLERYLQTGEKRIIGIGREVQGRRKDGSVFPVSLAVSEVDHLQLFTGIIRDITHRKELEREVLEISALEQRRIGQELHDDVGQRLTGLGMLADALQQQLAQDGSPRQEAAARVAAELGRVREQSRKLTQGLVPIDVAADGLPAALEGLAAGAREQAGVACELDCPEQVTFRDALIATHLFRIAQEAVHNALRHGNATHIALGLVRQDHDVVLTIRDDGTGIPQPADETKGLGIRLMRNRASLIGGRLEIGLAKRGGTVVACQLPWSANR